MHQTCLTLSSRRPALFERLARSCVTREGIVVNADPADTITTARAAALGWQVYLPGRTLAFAVGYNRAARLATGSHLVLLHDDAVLTPDTLPALWTYRDHDVVGVVVRHTADGRITHGGGAVDAHGTPCPLDRDVPFTPRLGFRPCLWASAVVLQVRRDAWERLRGFDESYTGWGDSATLDLCCRAHEAGLAVGVALDAIAWHDADAAPRPAVASDDAARWRQHWHEAGRLARLQGAG